MDVPLALVLMACVFTIYIKGSDSLQLTSSPATASPGQPYTLMCSRSGSGSRSRHWYWRNDMIFRTRYVSDTRCIVDISHETNYRHLSGRANVTCSLNQYNVTLRILTSIDNGSQWWCVDELSSQESNRLTIRVVNIITVSSTTSTEATTTIAATLATSTTAAITAKSGISSSTSLQGVDAPNVVYIAVGAAVGGIVVGCVITAIVVIVWMRRRNTSSEDDASAPNIYTSPSNYEDMGHQYGKVERQYTEDQAGNAAYYNTAGQHQHLDRTYYNTACDADS